MIFNPIKTRLGLLLALLLFLSVSFVQGDWLTINSIKYGTVSTVYTYATDAVILVAGRVYAFSALGIGGWNTVLYLADSNGASTNNDNWGGTNDPLSSRIVLSANGGACTIYTQSIGGVGTYALVVSDLSACSPQCISCGQSGPLCSICPAQVTCYACSGGLFPYGGACLSSCPPGSYFSGSTCYTCQYLHPYCTSCSSSACLSCAYGYLAYSTTCTYPCPTTTYNNNGVCTACSTLHPYCVSCSSSTSCLSCAGGYKAYGATCVASCPSGSTFSNDGIACYPCSSLSPYCTSCDSPATCHSCSYGLVASGSGCVGACTAGNYNNNGTCIACNTLNYYCSSCNSSTTCTGCSSGMVASGAACTNSCPSGTYNNTGECTSCMTLDNSCTACNSSVICNACSTGLVALGSNCIGSCPAGTFNSSGVCTSCFTLDNNCLFCNSSTHCTNCLSNLFALGSTCIASCPSGTYSNNGICTSCSTLTADCSTCTNSITCTSCDNGKYAFGTACLGSCPNGTYNNAGNCISCSALDSSCLLCNSSLTCQACSGGLLALGQTCVSSCPTGTYNGTTQCLSCATLDPNCLECLNEKSCTSCAGGRLIYGPNCLTSCPQGTSNNGGICTVNPLKISLINTDSANIYLAQFPAALTNDIQVIAVSKVTLVGVETSAYSIILTRQSNTVYQINIQYSQTIPSTTLKFVYTLNGSPATTNLLRGQWTAEITSKYMAYMSEGDKKAVEAVNKVAGGTMQGAATGASSMAIFGGNPALLWPLLNLFQTFYYLIFIDVNYPANVQMFLKIFSLGSLTFLPNPLDWFVHDIDQYNLPVPKRYNDYNFSGLFLDNAGNEFLLLAFVFGLYLISKIVKKWARKLPTSIRFSTNKTVEWFEWSGILRSLITSYTDIAQAVFLQLKVLTFYSTVFTVSCVLTFLTLGFIVIFPVFLFLIIRKFNGQPELLLIKYETLVGEYDIKRASSRNFLVIWLARRFIMCLSLVFLQGYPYVQINVLCILIMASIVYTWAYAPYNTKKENICNTLMELLFGLIHGVIYVLIYDDHNPSFTDAKRLQMGWIIIFACGAILLISLGLNLLEQVRLVIRGFRLLKKLMSKKDKKKAIKSNARITTTMVGTSNNSSSTSILNEKIKLFDPNRSTHEASFDLSLSQLVQVENVPPQPVVGHSRNMLQMKRMRKAKLANRIRELREMNS